MFTNVHGTPMSAPRVPADLRGAGVARSADLAASRIAAPTSPDYKAEDRSQYEIWWTFGWPYETSAAMARLVFAGYFDRSRR